MTRYAGMEEGASKVHRNATISPHTARDYYSSYFQHAQSCLVAGTAERLGGCREAVDGEKEGGVLTHLAVDVAADPHVHGPVRSVLGVPGVPVV